MREHGNDHDSMLVQMDVFADHPYCIDRFHIFRHYLRPYSSKFLAQWEVQVCGSVYCFKICNNAWKLELEYVHTRVYIYSYYLALQLDIKLLFFHNYIYFIS